MIRLALAALFLFLAPPWLHAAEGDLLDPEKAFRFSARLVDPANVEARFLVAKGYYLYKDKIKFSAEGAKLGPAALPSGKIKTDEVFGRTCCARSPSSRTRSRSRSWKRMMVTSEAHGDSPK